MYSYVQVHLHKDSYLFDDDLTGLEEDLDKTTKLLGE